MPVPPTDPDTASSRAPAVLTGAEAVCHILQQHGVDVVFAYPGTSELALCDSVAQSPRLRLINGRGDRESAFMAAGASLRQPNRGVAILHGARGLTNAVGAVADARRNEVGTLFLVGLATTSSARFLPPHEEPNLISSIGNFTSWSWEAPAVPDEEPARLVAAEEFVHRLHASLEHAARLPAGPSMFGLPQDVAETRWIPAEMVQVDRQPPVRVPQPATAELARAVAELERATRPLFLVDDYALRYPGVREALDALTSRLGAPVFQLRYRRGPMLFERLRGDEVRNFAGWLNQFSPVHNDLLTKCDLLVTVEDRNIYRRVVGELPSCQKIAVNGAGEKVRKNEYLTDGDLLLEGDVTATLWALADRMGRHDNDETWCVLPEPVEAFSTPEPASADVEQFRTEIVGALARTLAGWPEPVLVDDSQMFGGLISERYDLLPRGLRVFGGHSGFVGGGLALATGLAIGDPGCRVLCTLGDQGFTNCLQGLVAALQSQAPIIYLVCNNGESVSLKKQAAAGDPTDGDDDTSRTYLGNVPGLTYHGIAAALGVPSWQVTMTPAPAELADGAVRLRHALAMAQEITGPALVELVVPADPQVWRGIWLTTAFDQPQRLGKGRPGIRQRLSTC